MRWSQQTWLWRKLESMNVPHKRPPTWRLAPSHLPSPSQRPLFHPAPAVDLTVPRPLPSPQKPPSFWQCQKSVPGRSQLPRPWPCLIQAAEIPSSSFPAFSPGTPIRSLNESEAVPLVNALDLWISGQCLPSTSHNAPSASWSEADFSLPWWSQPPQQTRRCHSKANSSQAACKGADRQPDLHSKKSCKVFRCLVRPIESPTKATGGSSSFSPPQKPDSQHHVWDSVKSN